VRETVRRALEFIAALIVAVALLGAGLSGCATAIAPSVSLRAVDASYDQPDGVVMWFELEVMNTDTVDLPLAEVRYSVRVGGEVVFEGVRSAEATAPARGSAVIRLPAATPRLTGVGPGDEVRIEGRLTYLTPSRLAEVLFDAELHRPEQAFSARATLPGLDPGAAPAKPRR